MIIGFQYLLIGFIALCGMIIRFNGRSVYVQMLAWFVIATVLSVLRFVVLAFSEWTRRGQWRTISRRNW
jgi:hypothetical protein